MVVGDWGQNSGHPWSKRDSLEVSLPKITAAGHEKAGWGGTRKTQPNWLPTYTGEQVNPAYGLAGWAGAITAGGFGTTMSF